MVKKLTKKITRSKYINIEIHDYVLRAVLLDNTQEQPFVCFEKVLNTEWISDGEIIDEVSFFDALKNAIEEWGMKHYRVCFFVPEQHVLMRAIDIPEEVTREGLHDYVEMEIGNSIHLPFEDPVIDLSFDDDKSTAATLYAAPREDVNRLAQLLEDASLHPEVAAVRMLCNGRFLLRAELLSEEKTTLVADLSLNGISIGIYSGSHLEFLRFQDLAVSYEDWNFGNEEAELSMKEGTAFETYEGLLIDQVLEVGRIINFYQFSLYKGEKTVDNIVLMGDNPYLHVMESNLKESQSQQLFVVDDHFMAEHYPGVRGKFAALIGLALREEL